MKNIDYHRKITKNQHMIIVNYFYLSKANLMKLKLENLSIIIVNFKDFTSLFGQYQNNNKRIYLHSDQYCPSENKLCLLQIGTGII